MKVRYVVSQIDWAKGDRAYPYLRRTPRTTPVADYKTFEAAEFDRRRREEQARAGVNPFRYGGESLFYQTDFAAPYLHDWLMDAAINPPERPQAHGDWVAWWDRCAHAWSAAQLEHAWAAMHKVGFFEITEAHPDRKAYVVVEVNWTWHDMATVFADHEGGNVVRAYRSKANADAECARLNRERQQQPRHAGYSSFTREWRGDGSDSRQTNMEETQFFEVVEIELGDAE
jgi:hypothetical protein